MKVEQLIEELKKFPGHLNVIFVEGLDHYRVDSMHLGSRQLESFKPEIVVCLEEK